MRSLVFESALLPRGWAEEVTVTVDDGGDIVAVTEGAAVAGAATAGGCLLPGIPNLHSHAHQRAMAGLGERSGQSEDSFWSWREVMYRHLQRMQPDQLEAIAAQLYLEMLKSGYTSVAEFQYLHHAPDGRPYGDVAEMSLRALAAAREVGIGITNLPVLYRYGGFGAQPPAPAQRRFVNDADRLLAIVERLRAESAHDPDAATGVAPHSLRAVTGELLDEVLTGFGSSGPIHIHVAEQVGEVEECTAWSGRRPVQWLFDNQDIDARWCLVHATHMNAQEITLLARSGAVAGLCPTTEANLGDGPFEAVAFAAEQGRFGVGSDSNISVSPVEELRWLEYGQRLKHRRRNVLAGGPNRSTARQLLEGALAGGAQACGRRVGRIEPGYRADLLVIDSDHPLLLGRKKDALLDSWVFAGNVNLVRDVYVGGKRVIHEGVHARQEPIGARFRQVMGELAE
jgi:formimidoylglutamate deiminase